jgi:hypothetical protein
MQLTVVENAFRVLKSELLIRPAWHHYSGRTKAQRDGLRVGLRLVEDARPLVRASGAREEIQKPDHRRGNAAPKPRPMTPEVILQELGNLQIGDILLETTDGRNLALRKVALAC